MTAAAIAPATAAPRRSTRFPATASSTTAIPSTIAPPQSPSGTETCL